MKSSELGQVVISPQDATDELLAAVNAAVASGTDIKLSKRTVFRLYLADIVHPIGIHHWVQYRTYDPRTNRIIVHPRTWVCAKCTAGKLE